MISRTLRARPRHLYLLVGSFTVLLMGLAFCLLAWTASAPNVHETMWR